MTQEMIDKLTEVGFNRWTKGNMDRLYINAAQLGLVCEYYHTGNIKYAELNGKSVSNSEARRMKASKTFVDLKTEKVYSDNSALQEAAEALILQTVGARE